MNTNSIQIAHRGKTGLSASAYNSLTGLKEVYNAGIQGIELDVRQTADSSRYVCFHDSSISNGSVYQDLKKGLQSFILNRKISSLRPEYLQKLNLLDLKGIPTEEPILFFEDAVSMLKKLRINTIMLDLKGDFKKLPQLLDQCSPILKNVVFSGMNHEVLDRLKVLDDKVTIAYSFNRYYLSIENKFRTIKNMIGFMRWSDNTFQFSPKKIVDQFKNKIGEGYLNFRDSLLTPRRLSSFRAEIADEPIGISTWTVNDLQKMRLFTDAKISMIVSDLWGVYNNSFPVHAIQTIR